MRVQSGVTSSVTFLIVMFFYKHGETSCDDWITESLVMYHMQIFYGKRFYDDIFFKKIICSIN